MLQRLDELDNENNDLRLQIADLEDARDKLQDEINRTTSERDALAKAVKEKEMSSVSACLLFEVLTTLWYS